MNVKTVSYNSPTAGPEFAASLRETGFAVVTDHILPGELIQNVITEWAEFFASEDKFRYTYDPARQSGYFPFKSENAKGYSQKDLKEFYHYYPWDKLPDATQKTTEMYQILNAMGSRLLSWIEEATPTDVRKRFSMPLSQMIEGSQEILLRTIHYPPLTGTEEDGAVRAAAHEDINLITLLPSASAPGLQAMDLAGRWHDVPCDPGMIVVNSGDMLKEASGGHYPSTTHRVINPSGPAARVPRFSMPLFLHPCKDVRLSERHTAGSYLTERLREIGLKPKA